MIFFDHLLIGQLDECRRLQKVAFHYQMHLMSFDCLVVYKNFLPVNQTLFPTNKKLSRTNFLPNLKIFETERCQLLGCFYTGCPTAY